uniref:Uncharacterized protein n=1 Tax=Anopheles atroparvus TaxID=41427 RepID=A0A182J1A1_ANOAO
MTSQWRAVKAKENCFPQHPSRAQTNGKTVDQGERETMVLLNMEREVCVPPAVAAWIRRIACIILPWRRGFSSAWKKNPFRGNRRRRVGCVALARLICPGRTQLSRFGDENRNPLVFYLPFLTQADSIREKHRFTISRHHHLHHPSTSSGKSIIIIISIISIVIIIGLGLNTPLVAAAAAAASSSLYQHQPTVSPPVTPATLYATSASSQELSQTSVAEFGSGLCCSQQLCFCGHCYQTQPQGLFLSPPAPPIVASAAQSYSHHSLSILGGQQQQHQQHQQQQQQVVVGHYTDFQAQYNPAGGTSNSSSSSSAEPSSSGASELSYYSTTATTTPFAYPSSGSMLPMAVTSLPPPLAASLEPLPGVPVMVSSDAAATAAAAYYCQERQHLSYYLADCDGGGGPGSTFAGGLLQMATILSCRCDWGRPFAR